VELVELLGGEGLVHLTAGPVELTARIPPDRIHFFDVTTTERIAP
jgi:hypothetical protein